MYEPDEIGPFAELAQLSAGRLLPAIDQNPWISLNRLPQYYEFFATPPHNWKPLPPGSPVGIIRLSHRLLNADIPWTLFCLSAQKAAKSAGFSNKTAKQFVGAIIELYDNIYEHSEAADTGVVAFRASPKKFEFVISDLGIGVLASLKSCEEHSNIRDHEGALRIALSEGGSRYGSGTGRGMGYRQLFVGLANLTATLRFRSGDFAITIDGSRPSLINSRSAQKPFIQGLFVSVACYLSDE